MLTTSSYSPAKDTHDFKDYVTNEVTGTGYSAGGATLGSKTLTAGSDRLTVRMNRSFSTPTPPS